MSETQTQDPIQAAIARAQQAASQAALTQANAVAPPANTNVPATAPMGQMPARRLTEADLVGQSMAVDEWINVSEHGLIFGKNKLLVLDENVIVGIDLEAVAYGETIKFGKQPAQYRKTFDRVNDSRGGSWADSVAMAQRIDPQARPYRSADIPMVLLMDVKAKGGVVFPTGTVVGYSTSTTGFAKWDGFITDARRRGFAGRCKVKLGSEAMSRNGNTWGVITYSMIGVHEGDFPEKAPKAA